MSKLDLMFQFRDRLEEVSGECHFLSDEETVNEAILKFLWHEGIGSVVIGKDSWKQEHRESLQNQAIILADFSTAGVNREDAIDACARAGAGIFKATALIAGTGTVVIESHDMGDRLVSTLPPTSIIIADKAPVYAMLEEYMQQASRDISFSFITGPSRTADIEKKLVLGVHGPIRVVVWVRE